MKKITSLFLILLLTVSIFLLGFDYNRESVPNEYYQVYLDDQLLGVIDSKKELEEYIDNQGEAYKKKYNVDKVYQPNGLKIEKIVTYDARLDEVKDVYEKIKELKPFTIKGSQLTIKGEEENLKIYALNEEIFSEALESAEITFVGDEKYNAYINNSQEVIETTGTIVENVYIDNEFTIKRDINISVEEKIYTNSKDLAQFLIFGNNTEKKTYKVKTGDTISSIAFDNEISVTELLLSNPDFTNSSNLLFPGQELLIGITDPQIDVVVVEYVVEDVASGYKIEEKYDSTQYVGYEKVVQKGKEGLDRISKRVKTVNGVINNVDTESRVVLTEPVNKIIVMGSKVAYHIGSLTNWSWPTENGWTITSDYAYRIHPIKGNRELHPALDISGTGHGSDIYAVNNGTVITSTYESGYGNYIVINHNNGYYTLYAHLASKLVKTGQTVERGFKIGTMGMTGTATGPHLHFELWTGGAPFRGGSRINPWTIYR